MDIEELEHDLDESVAAILAIESKIDMLDDIYVEINASGCVSRSQVMAVESVIAGAITESYPVEYFSSEGSPGNANLATEGVVKAVGTIILEIVRTLVEFVAAIVKGMGSAFKAIFTSSGGGSSSNPVSGQLTSLQSTIDEAEKLDVKLSDAVKDDLKKTYRLIDDGNVVKFMGMIEAGFDFIDDAMNKSKIVDTVGTMVRMKPATNEKHAELLMSQFIESIGDCYAASTLIHVHLSELGKLSGIKVGDVKEIADIDESTMDDDPIRYYKALTSEISRHITDVTSVVGDFKIKESPITEKDIKGAVDAVSDKDKKLASKDQLDGFKEVQGKLAKLPTLTKNLLDLSNLTEKEKDEGKGDADDPIDVQLAIVSGTSKVVNKFLHLQSKVVALYLGEAKRMQRTIDSINRAVAAAVKEAKK